MKKDWTEILKDKLSESAVTPPDSLWEGISSQLDVQLPKSQLSINSKSWLKWTVAASVATIVGVTVYNSLTYVPPQETSGVLIAQNSKSLSGVQNESYSDQNEAVKYEVETIAEKSSTQLPTASNHSIVSSNISHPIQKPSNILSDKGQSSTDHSSINRNQSFEQHQDPELLEPSYEEKEQNYVVHTDGNEHENVLSSQNINTESNHVGLVYTQQKSGEENAEEINTQESMDSYYASIMNHYKELLDNEPQTNSDEDFELWQDAQKSNHNLSIAVYASTSDAYKTSSLSSGFGNIMGNITDSDPGGGGSDYFPPDNTEDSKSRSSSYKEVMEAKHRQPLRFGLSFRYPLSTYISLSTGIVYSFLSSTFGFGEGKAYESDQTLNYLGVPVSIEYSLPSYRNFGFYLTMGAMVEKCVYGRSKASNRTVYDKVSERAFQTSMFAGVGVEYKLHRAVSVYAEPLATYYFNNHSKVVNIYKDRKLNVDLRLGFRFNLK